MKKEDKKEIILLIMVAVVASMVTSAILSHRYGIEKDNLTHNLTSECDSNMERARALSYEEGKSMNVKECEQRVKDIASSLEEKQRYLFICEDKIRNNCYCKEGMVG